MTQQIAATGQGLAAQAFNIAGHALVGCASAEASGAGCGPSALAGAITSAAGPFVNHLGFVGSLVANTVVGGLAAVAGGGKFENGAITGAFGYLFNDVGHMLVGTDAHYQLLAYLIRRDGPALWTGNTAFGGLFGGGRPDLIYNEAPYQVFEIKPDGSEAAGAKQLQNYLNTPGSQSVAGDWGLISPLPSLPLTGGWFGEAIYTFRPSAYPGVITYTVDTPNIFQQALSLFSQRPVGAPLPLPPRLPPVIPVPLP